MTLNARAHEVDAKSYIWDGSTWVASTGGGGGAQAEASTQVSISNFSTQVSIGNQPTVTVSGYVAPSTTVSVANFPASQAVTGTFFQATQPVSLASVPAHGVNLFDSTGQSIESSTRCNAGSTMRGLAVRSVTPDCTSAGGFSSASGDLTVFSSGSQAYYVYAYSVTVYSSVANIVRLMNGSTVVGWYIKASGVNGGGTGSTGAPNLSQCQLAISPPGYLFKTSTGNPVIMSRSSTGHFSWAVSAWREG